MSVIQHPLNATDKVLSTRLKYRKKPLFLSFQSQNHQLLSQWIFQLMMKSCLLPSILTPTQMT
jgi:hypothetical protein